MIAVTYWEGWVLAHPAPALITAACAGVLTVLAVLTKLENRRDDRDNGLPPSPRRANPRSRARGTRAWRQVTVRACRRAGTTRAWATSWFWWLGEWHPGQAARERIALRARGITIDVGGSTPLGPEPDVCPDCGSPPDGLCGAPSRDYCRWMPPEPTRKATDAERAAAAPWYAPELAPRAELSPWEHQTQWFSLKAIDDDIKAREAAAGGDT